MSKTMKTAPEPIRRWHELVAARDARGLDALLADDVAFHSPVVHTPQHGKGLAKAYLGAALTVFGNEHFHYVGEWVGESSVVLEFNTEIDGVEVDGVDMIGWNAEGKIISFKVMVRPLKAIDAVRQRMAAMLAQQQQQQQ